MKIAAWNVNSVRVRLPHLLQWLADNKPDVALLQETKTKDENFPHAEINAAGYHCAHYGQAAYNGVAILSRSAQTEVVAGMPRRPDDAQARVIAATVDGVRVISVYVPNGQSAESDKYRYKMEWLADFTAYLGELSARPTVAGGDYNIAPADEDMYDAKKWGCNVPATPPEREAFRTLLAAGYRDAHRLFPREEKVFSWWDYRHAAFRRDNGLRIDMLLLSEPLAKRCVACLPDKTPRGWERPSDHAPVVGEFSAA